MGGVKLRRVHDWRQRLNDYLVFEARQKFEWGKSDCALFAAGAVNAMTGFDPANEFRGKYDSLCSGIRLLRKRGYADHVDLAMSMMPKHRPMLGSIAVVKQDEMKSMGVVIADVVLVRTRTGIGSVHISAAEEFLKCG